MDTMSSTNPIYQEISGRASLFLQSKTPKKQNWLLEKIVTTFDQIIFTREFTIESSP